MKVKRRATATGSKRRIHRLYWLLSFNQHKLMLELAVWEPSEKVKADHLSATLSLKEGHTRNFRVFVRIPKKGRPTFSHLFQYWLEKEAFYLNLFSIFWPKKMKRKINTNLTFLRSSQRNQTYSSFLFSIPRPMFFFYLFGFITPHMFFSVTLPWRQKTGVKRDCSKDKTKEKWARGDGQTYARLTHTVRLFSITWWASPIQWSQLIFR